ncbi:lamin tail domain-containing protein [Nonomuraea turkmeniaca]|nr:lamin tail domain-containing protein [Nonomuraea turkmeniaca]
MRLNKSAILFVGVVIAASMTTGPATASADVPGDVLRIVEVGTDAMGADSYANRNREFVKFQNVSDGPIDVANVLVEDNWAHAKTVKGDAHTCNTYKIVDLPDNGTTVIAKGEYVTVFNGSRLGGDRKINGSEYQLFADSDTDCGTAGQFFNNNNDTAWVTKANGDVLSSYSWDHNGGYVFKP